MIVRSDQHVAGSDIQADRPLFRLSMFGGPLGKSSREQIGKAFAFRDDDITVMFQISDRPLKDEAASAINILKAAATGGSVDGVYGRCNPSIIPHH